MAPVIEARDMHHRFGFTVALDGLSLVAEAWQVLALLGPNRSGQDHLRPSGHHPAATAGRDAAGRRP
jgi:ABC-type branched-subunit amino acid transport system ATPase component